MNPIPTDGWQVTAVIISSISAITASIALIQNAKTQKAILINSIHERFFKIQSEAAANINAERESKYYELISNFFEYISFLVNNRRIKLKDIELMHETILSLWNSYGKTKKLPNGAGLYTYWELSVLKNIRIRSLSMASKLIYNLNN